MKGGSMVGTILLIVGIVLVLGSLLADTLGLGDSSGLGTAQIAGLVAGVILAVVGLFLAKKASAKSPA